MSNTGPTLPQQRILGITWLIHRANHAYYCLAAPLYTDSAYDVAYKLLVELELTHSKYKLDHTATDKVGCTLPLCRRHRKEQGQVSQGFTKVRHVLPMLSLTSIHTEDEAKAWYKRIRKELTSTH